jgi:PKD repeat protein
MKTKLLLFAFLSFFAIKMNAQCSAQFTYTVSPNGAVIYTATGSAINPTSTLYSWNFGNGSAGVGQTVTTTYNGNGPYIVCLTVTDTFNTNGCTATWCDSIYLNGGSTPCSGTPNAGTTVASNTSPVQGSLVTFSLSGNTTGTGITYQWQRGISATSAFFNVGNGASTFSENLYSDYCYRCITTCTNSGLSDTSNILCVIPVAATACNASYTYNYNALLGNVTFTAATAGNATSAVYSWYNGSTLLSNGANYSTAMSPGNYNICLIVTNAANNCIDSSCQTVTIANPNTCNASFYIYPDSLGAPHTYIGVNNSTNGASVYSWSWGDGTTSTGQFPAHTYATAGNYNICLTVGTPSTSCYDTMCLAATINKTAAMYSVNFGTPTSVSSTSKEIATIYPNPAKDNFTIKGLSTATYRVEIMNLNGSILKSVSANGNQTINIASLANNIYILKITNQDGTSQFAKLIKE